MENTRAAGTTMENSWTSWSASRHGMRVITREKLIRLIYRYSCEGIFFETGNFWRAIVESSVYFFPSIKVYISFACSLSSMSIIQLHLCRVTRESARQLARQANWIGWWRGKLLSTGEKRKEEREKFILPLWRVNFSRSTSHRVIKIRPASRNKSRVLINRDKRYALTNRGLCGIGKNG